MEVIKLCLSSFEPRQKIRLLPFIITSTCYLLQPYPHNTLVGVTFKVLPMMSLILYVMMERSRFPLQTRSVSLDTLIPTDTYSAYILCGLVLSMLADVFVTAYYTGLLGVLVFAVAHILYVLGINESGRHIGSQSNVNSLYILFFVDIFLLVQSCVEGVFWKVVMFVYFIPLFLAAWKAGAAYRRAPASKACMFAFLGGVSFVLSDVLIVLYHTHCFCIPFGIHIYMLLYYFAQLGWAVSTSD